MLHPQDQGIAVPQNVGRYLFTSKHNNRRLKSASEFTLTTSLHVEKCTAGSMTIHYTKQEQKYIM
jgi:hypothetical protein